MSPYDECEIFGVWAPTGNCAHTVYYSLFVFQHWGQEPCSIAVIRDRELTFCKDMGLVGVVFSPELLDQLVGHHGPRPLRFPTTRCAHPHSLTLSYVKDPPAMTRSRNL